MKRLQVVYARGYDVLTIGLRDAHPFDMKRPSRAFGLLKQRGVLRRVDVHRPGRIGAADLRLVHTDEYLRSLRSSAVIARIVEVGPIARIPFPLVNFALLRPMRRATAGTVLAAELALRHGAAVNMAGGFHHAGPDRGEGFCVYADIAIAINTLREKGKAQKVLYIDLDAHQGNGVARCFMNDRSVAILDMYNSMIYPGDEEARRAIRWEVRLNAGTGDEAYVERLAGVLASAVREFKPDFAVYNAGTDVVKADAIGLMKMSEEGVFQRDRMVIDGLVKLGVPWIMLPSGGYSDASHRMLARAVEYAAGKVAE